MSLSTPIAGLWYLQYVSKKIHHCPALNITMAWHERHVVSHHRSFNCLFESLCGPTSRKHQSLHYWPFVRGMHRWPVNFPHTQRTVTAKKLTFDDVTMAYVFTIYKLYLINNTRFSMICHLLFMPSLSANSSNVFAIIRLSCVIATVNMYHW